MMGFFFQLVIASLVFAVVSPGFVVLVWHVYDICFLPAVLLHLRGADTFPPSVPTVLFEIIYAYILTVSVKGIAWLTSRRHP
jgi:hypothetical protein